MPQSMGMKALLKNILRKQQRKVRALTHLNGDELTHLNQMIINRLLRYYQYLKGKRTSENQFVISGYYPIQTEFNIMPSLKALKKYSSIKLALPEVTGKGDPLIFWEWDPSMDMTKKKDKFKIPIPSCSMALVPDIILCPMLGFNDYGGRLGYGGGYYDRTILEIIEHQHKTPIKIGIAYENQKCTMRGIAHDWDVLLDEIITEKFLYRISAISQIA